MSERELRGGNAEERLGRGLDAVCAAAEVHGVQVVREDLVFRHPLLEAARDDDLVPLARDGAAAVVQVHVARQLHGDRAAALLDLTAGRVDDQRPAERADVDAVVRVEPLVLDRNDGLADEHGHPLERDGLAVLLAVQDREQPAVRGVDLRSGVDVRSRGREEGELVRVTRGGVGEWKRELRQGDAGGEHAEQDCSDDAGQQEARSIHPEVSRDRKPGRARSHKAEEWRAQKQGGFPRRAPALSYPARRSVMRGS